ncbi:MAG TPA: M20/M25/M40 family metallo-hydrolase [Tepidisphaeraceae bacterium]|jgi:acetylornithine deacetylase|nr:M20/M25/M40 family metallo-hydrolase [Tepidisphaeraceae bacterium]
MIAQLDRAVEMKRLLQEWIAIPSISGSERAFVQSVAEWAGDEGLETDLWYAEEADVTRVAKLPARHLPLAGRPTLVLKLPGNGGGRSLMFNAHSDVVGAPESERWTMGPWSGGEMGGEIYGRGACDVKGPLVAALWGMVLLKEKYPAGLAGDVMLELVPGEEDCVGLGTLTSIARGYRTDGVVVLEPTENMPRCASRGGCRFEIVVRGQAVHGTVKWLGKDAIRAMREVLAAIDRMEARWNERGADELFAAYPIARPMTVDMVHGGQWQGMVCDRCGCGGYLELLPGDDMQACKDRFVRELREEVGEAVDVQFGEEYQGHRLSQESAFCKAAQSAFGNGWTGWSGFNSGCEAGTRAEVLGTPTLVWGPGTLAYAHAVDERIGFAEVATSARMFAEFAAGWSNTKDNR